MAKLWQEFYCQGCGGYFRVKLNTALNMFVEMHCPGVKDDGTKCDRKHRRVIEDGHIKERFSDGRDRHSQSPTEEICPTSADYSKEPWTAKMKMAADKAGDKENDIYPRYCGDRREGVVIEERPMSPAQMERWAEVAARRGEPDYEGDES